MSKKLCRLVCLQALYKTITAQTYLNQSFIMSAACLALSSCYFALIKFKFLSRIRVNFGTTFFEHAKILIT